MKSFKWFGLVMTLVLVLAACSKEESKSAGTKFDKNEKVTLKVLYFNDQAFYAQYGNMFQAKYPNVEFEVIPSMGSFGGGDKDPAKAFEKLIDDNKPDIIMMTTSQYEQLSKEGKLYALDTVIKQDKFDIENMAPGVIEFLKNKGGNKLYGLSPSFSTKALFYNKDLFDQQGIPYPTDKMSWEEVIQLASQFPPTGTDETRVYGLSQSMFMQNPFELVENIANSKQLSVLDVEGKHLTMDAPEWKSIFETVINAYQKKAISQSGNMMSATLSLSSVAPVAASDGATNFVASGNSNLFTAGRAAMMIDYSFLMTEIDMMKTMNKDVKEINWGVVTEPVDPLNPEVSDSFSLSQIAGIHAESAHVGAAWEFIKYIHSDEVAKIHSKSSTDLIARTAYAVDKQGRSLEAFYKLKPNSDTTTQRYPKGFRAAFNKITAEETKAVIAKTKTLEEALAAIKEQGNKALTEANVSGELESEANNADMGGAVFIN